MIFDIDFSKLEDGIKDNTYKETSNSLEIMIPLPEQLKGKESYAGYRYNEGTVDKITEAINTHSGHILEALQ